MNDMESGTPPERDGTSLPLDGYKTAQGRYFTQVKEMLREISSHGQFIPKFTKYVDTGGHDHGDEDPNAWTN